jgi:ATP-dependent DNA helicase 2 subunit 2
MSNAINKQFKKKKISPVSKFRGPMILTPSVFIDVAVYTKTIKVDLPSLKKHSLATEVDLDDVKTGGIQMERVYYVNDDPDQNPLGQEYITKAYNYGSSLVPISKTDEVLFKNSEEKCLKTIGFTDNYRVPRNYYMCGVDLVIPNPTNEDDIRAFCAIVQEMHNSNKVMICRYVYRNNADPKLVVLSPHIGKNGPVLYLNSLPTVEDIRDFQFESLKESTMKQEEVVSKFIDSLDLEKDDEDRDINENLKPSETYNPVLQYFYQCLEDKVVKKDNNLPGLDENIGEYLKPDKKLFEGNKYVTFLPKIFEIKEKQKNEDKKKRVFWREMINNEILENTGISQKRLEEKLEAHKEEAKKNISTTRPIEDFKEMLNYKYSDLTVEAMKQMEEIIIKFIMESFKGSYYVKSMECLKALRESCIEEDEIDLFNDYMEKLRNDLPKEKFLDFWKLIFDNRISLISMKENFKSIVSEELSKNWLDSLFRKEVLTSTLNDLDDLIADID